MNRSKLRVPIIVLLSGFAFGFAHGGDMSGALPDEVTAAAPLSDADLGTERARGGGAINIGEFNLDANATLDHNTVYSSNTGNNSVSNGSFSSASGIATVIQNSGNNVIIQNSTVVNLSLHK